jgi:chaperonin GroES
MEINPIADYVLIEPIYHTQTNAGIFIPQDISEEYWREGKVIAVGPGKLSNLNIRIPMEIMIGDIVHLGVGGYDVTIDEKQYYMVREKHIKVILNRK